MPEFLRLLLELRQHMQVELTRSDVLRALIYPIAGLVLALAALAGRVEQWIISDLFAALCGFLGLYALVYILCFFIDRDALRSEKYKLQKMAIERGFYGDSETGLIERKKDDQLALGGPGEAEDANE
jgi:hypothetical protein